MVCDGFELLAEFFDDLVAGEKRLVGCLCVSCFFRDGHRRFNLRFWKCALEDSFLQHLVERRIEEAFRRPLLDEFYTHDAAI